MKVEIPLTPSEEARLSAAASRIGLAPEEWIKRLTLESLSADPETVDDALDAKLRQSQEQTRTPLMPDAPTKTLFAQWAEEDAHMTDDEREAEDRLWEDLEKSLLERRGLYLRQSGG